jgi:hypothetical protein
MAGTAYLYEELPVLGVHKTISLRRDRGAEIKKAAQYLVERERIFVCGKRGDMFVGKGKGDSLLNNTLEAVLIFKMENMK